MLTPVLLLAFLGTLQVGLWLHGKNVVQEAAAAAAETDSAALARPGEGSAMARRVAARGGLTDVAVDSRREQGMVRVTVSGRVPMLYALGLEYVRQEAVAPQEVW